MLLDPLLKIREHLQNDSVLNTYLTDTYPNTTPKYAVATKHPSGTEEYPWISFSLAGEVRDASYVSREQVVIIYISVFSPSTSLTDPYLYNGLVEVAHISELIMSSLSKFYPSRAVIKREMDTMTDFGIKHPFYSCGLRVTVTAKETLTQ